MRSNKGKYGLSSCMILAILGIGCFWALVLPVTDAIGAWYSLIRLSDRQLGFSNVQHAFWNLLNGNQPFYRIYPNNETPKVAVVNPSVNAFYSE